jgi:hypothetical protein
VSSEPNVAIRSDDTVFPSDTVSASRHVFSGDELVRASIGYSRIDASKHSQALSAHIVPDQPPFALRCNATGG